MESYIAPLSKTGSGCYVALTISKAKPWSSLVEGGEGSYLPNCQTTLVIALDALFLLFCIFINTTAYHLGRFKPPPPSTKELHALTNITKAIVNQSSRIIHA